MSNTKSPIKIGKIKKKKKSYQLTILDIESAQPLKENR